MLAFDSPREVAQRGYEAALPLLEEWLEGRDHDPSAAVAPVHPVDAGF
jgi:hypothetical protein